MPQTELTFVEKRKDVWRQSRARFNFTHRAMLNKFSMDSPVDLVPRPAG